MAEVASEMYISAATVKTHLSNIYRRLEAARHAKRSAEPAASA